MIRRAINVIEELAWSALDDLLPRIPDACGCEQCKLDIYTLALNKLEPHYVTGKRAFQEVVKIKKVEYHTRIMAAISASVEKVRRNPRSECQKLGFWGQSGRKVATEFEGARAETQAAPPTSSLPSSLEFHEVPAPTAPAPVVRPAGANYNQYGAPKRR